MSPSTKRIAILCCVAVAQAKGADATKVKVLDRLDRIDPKTLEVRDAKAKIVDTKDAEHPRALELVMDYAKPGSWPGLNKKFPEGTINPKKHVAIRYWVKSNSGTGYSVGFGGAGPRKDGKKDAFWADHPPATETWTLVTIPFEKLKRHSEKIWKNGAQHITPGGGEPPDAEDFANFNRFGFGSVIDWRGSATTGHLMFDGIELVEK